PRLRRGPDGHHRARAARHHHPRPGHAGLGDRGGRLARLDRLRPRARVRRDRDGHQLRAHRAPPPRGRGADVAGLRRDRLRHRRLLRHPVPRPADRVPAGPVHRRVPAPAGLAARGQLGRRRHQGARHGHPHRVLPRHALHHHLRPRRRRPLRHRMNPLATTSRPARSDSARPERDPSRPSAVRPLSGSQHPAVLIPGLKRLLIGAWEQKRWFLLALVGATAFGLLQIATSAIVGRVTEDVVVPSFRDGSPELGLIAAGGLAILGIAVARAVTVMARRVFAAAAQFELFGLYRERLVAVYAKVPLLWHRRQSTGTLLSSVYSDVEATFFAMAPFPFALSTIAMLIYATFVVARIDPVILL